MKKSCDLCGKEFENRVFDGKVRSIQHRRFCWDCTPFGVRNNKDLTRKSKKCKLCNTVKPLGEFYQFSTKGRCSQRQSSYCKPCMAKDVSERSRVLKAKCVEYRGGKCVVCGYDEYLGALDFHHVDPSTKAFNIGSRIAGARNFEGLKDELDKCVILCAICHRKVEAGDLRLLDPTTVQSL